MTQNLEKNRFDQSQIRILITVEKGLTKQNEINNNIFTFYIFFFLNKLISNKMT